MEVRKKDKEFVILLFFFAFKNTGLTKVTSNLSMNDSLSSDIYTSTQTHTHTPVTHSVIVRGRQRRTAHNTSQHWVKTHNGYFAR